MTKKKTHIAFNPDTMTVSDLRCCAKALEGILDDFDCFLMASPEWNADQAQEFAMRVLQVRDHYTTNREMQKAQQSNQEPTEVDQGLIPIPDGYAEQ